MAKKSVKKKGTISPTRIKKKRAKQKELPGVETPRNAKLEKLTAEYAYCRDNRMAWSQKEVEAKKRLIEAMKADKIKCYQCRDIEQKAELKPIDATATVKVVHSTGDDGPKKGKKKAA